MINQFDEDYYLNGPASGKSNYVNYSWRPELTLPLAARLIEVMCIGANDTVLDFGAARGFTVKALLHYGIDAWGYDISEWAVANCDPEVVGRIHTSIQHGGYDHVLIKDVCEHLEVMTLMRVADHLIKTTRKSIMVIVPLTDRVGGQYVRKEDDMDSTHVIRWPLEDWMSFFQKRVADGPWTVSGSWHIPGLKPTSLSYIKSCGFVSLCRDS